MRTAMGLSSSMASRAKLRTLSFITGFSFAEPLRTGLTAPSRTQGRTEEGVEESGASLERRRAIFEPAGASASFAGARLPPPVTGAATQSRSRSAGHGRGHAIPVTTADYALRSTLGKSHPKSRKLPFLKQPAWPDYQSGISFAGGAPATRRLSGKGHFPVLPVACQDSWFAGILMAIVRGFSGLLGACGLLIACGESGKQEATNHGESDATKTSGAASSSGESSSNGGGPTASSTGSNPTSGTTTADGGDSTSTSAAVTNGDSSTAGSSTSTTGGASSGGPTLAGCTMFPADNPWNTDISEYPLHPDSESFIDSIGRNTNLHPDFGTEWEGAPIGIPFVTVDSSQPGVAISFEYDDESDPGPYPIPPDAPIEGGAESDGDRHVLVLESDNCILYELFAAYPLDGGSSWEAGSGAIFDLSSNELRPDRWTSADAAGLPVLPGLVRYDEVVEKGELNHALRFTVSESQAGYIAPATHAASNSTDPNLPPMGLRVRMKASYDCSAYSSEVQVICTALKRFGMFVADNGSNWYVSGAHDPRWSDENLGDLKQIPGDAFEVVDTGAITPW